MSKGLLSPDGVKLLDFLRSKGRAYRDTLDIYRDVYTNRSQFRHYYKRSGATIFGDVWLCPLLRQDLEVLLQLKVIEPTNAGLKVNYGKLHKLIRMLKSGDIDDLVIDEKPLRYLLEKGEVFILRVKKRKATLFPVKKGYKYLEIARLVKNGKKVTEVRLEFWDTVTPGEITTLNRYVNKSGYGTITEWLKSVGANNKTKKLYLYRVLLIRKT